ncbi:hypothetical protein [Streptomyces sp. RFCAC02]|uniref:hypothetical protein n=1 Tax=Streptomyces sp. RFCAC02 TaxID=2499143 RepID=UPI00101FA336|nr:hypothetical protein [Streptomyces sp. RFCAC02]
MTMTTDHVTPDRIDALLTDESVPVVHRALWALLWETDIRILDLLALDVSDAADGAADGGGPRPGGAAVGARTAALLGTLAGDRTAGPLFAVGERADRALTWEEAVRTASGHGVALHALRAGGKARRERLS